MSRPQTLDRVPKAGLVFGPSDASKTSQIYWMADYVYEKYGKTTRVITADGGGGNAVLQDLINIGVIETVSLMNDKNPVETFNALLEGYWLPYIEEKGKPPRLTPPASSTWDKVGGYGFEGLYSIAKLVAGWRSAQAPGSPGSWTALAGGASTKNGQLSMLQDGSEYYVEIGQKGYDAMLNKMYKFVTQSSVLPAHKILWTTLIQCFESKDQAGNVIDRGPWGPMMIGKQAIVSAPQWFGDLIHLDILNEKPPAGASTKGIAEKKIIRGWLKSHKHAKDGLPVPSKPRVMPNMIHLLPDYKDFSVEYDAKGNPIPMTEGLMNWLYKEQDKLEALGTSQSKDRMARYDAARAVHGGVEMPDLTPKWSPEVKA